MVQRARASGVPARPSTAQAEPVRDVLRGPGQPLAQAVREDMEARLGADLSGVRIHTDSAAHRAAQAISARAFTAGSHIAFQRSQYNPASAEGRHTLAHELTHVLQQRSGPVTGTDYGGLRVSEPADRFERAADENAHRAISGSARFCEGRDATASVRVGQRAADIQPTRQDGIVQRYTEVGDRAGTLLSQNGRYKVIPGEPTVWGQTGVVVQNVLKPLTKGKNMSRFPGYIAYQLGRYALRDCLHAAEEIINGLPGELEPGDDQGRGGLHSSIQVNVTGGTAIVPFGEDYKKNVALAKKFIGPKDVDASPLPGQAFIIIATSYKGTLSPYHAAAVVGRDGNDAVTLETWADKGESLPKADMYEVGDNDTSFHGYWSKKYFGKGKPTTVVIGPATGNLARASKKRKENPNTK